MDGWMALNTGALLDSTSYSTPTFPLSANVICQDAVI